MPASSIKRLTIIVARLVVELMPTVLPARDGTASGSAALLGEEGYVDTPVRTSRSRTVIVAAVLRISVKATSAMWENPGAIQARRVQRGAEEQGGSMTTEAGAEGDEVQAWIDADWSDLVRRCHVATLDVSCSSFRVPVARLAAAQAVLSLHAGYVSVGG
jgi:hypothetical protein